jgi:hypothetical protein
MVDTPGYLSYRNRDQSTDLPDFPAYFHLFIQNYGKWDKQGKEKYDDQILNPFGFKQIVIAEWVHGN